MFREAVRRAKAWGRLSIKKPADPMQLGRSPERPRASIFHCSKSASPSTPPSPTCPSVSFRDAFQGVTNIAMGRAPNCWGGCSGCLPLPIPNVNILEWRSCIMALGCQRGGTPVGICQGYIAAA